jgi:hypothetical protein
VEIRHCCYLVPGDRPGVVGADCGAVLSGLGQEMSHADREPPGLHDFDFLLNQNYFLHQ